MSDDYRTPDDAAVAVLEPEPETRPPGPAVETEPVEAAGLTPIGSLVAALLASLR